MQLVNIKAIVAYDGTRYLGWQRTKMGPSVEEELGNVLERILQQRVLLQAASRTDAGVHATGQVVNFLTDKDVGTSETLLKLRSSLNGLLPDDIVVLSLERAPESFHPTLQSTTKEYHYHMCYGATQLPHRRFYSWHYPIPELNLKEMRQAIPLLLGEHDFSAFCNAKKNERYAHYVRNLQSIEILEEANQNLCFKVIGTHFLYKMVRNLVGTLVYIGCGKLELENLPAILLGKDRTRAGMTAPACGLFLHKVNY